MSHHLPRKREHMQACVDAIRCISHRTQLGKVYWGRVFFCICERVWQCTWCRVLNTKTFRMPFSSVEFALFEGFFLWGSNKEGVAFVALHWTWSMIKLVCGAGSLCWYITCGVCIRLKLASVLCFFTFMISGFYHWVSFVITIHSTDDLLVRVSGRCWVFLHDFA